MCDVGSHYLALCEGVTGPRAADAQSVADAIREIMSGARADCIVESRIPPEGHLLVTRLTRFAGRGPLRLVVAHQLVAAIAPKPAEPESAPREERAEDAAYALERERVAREQIEGELRAREEELRALASELAQRVEERVAERDRFVAALRAAEDARERMAEELRDFYDDAPCGYHALDERGVVRSINRTALGWLGYERDELVGTHRFAELLTPASRRRFDAALPELEARGWVHDLELDVIRKDGSILPVSLSTIAVTDGDGRCLRSRSAMFDVTARRGVEERVEALQHGLAARRRALDEANRELESRAHSTSDALRTPLRAIDGAARILDDESGDQLDAAGRQHLGIIRESAAHMAQAIDAMLDLSRLDRRPLDRTPVDMTALARTVADEVGRRHRTRDVTSVVEGLAPAVGDVGLLRQLFANLVGNAFKFTSTVAHPCVDVGSVDADGTPVYYVRDNGAGFDMRDADKLFDVFDSPPELAGTGIGLALVQRIVDRHGGRVWAEGRVGDGATFFFTLGRKTAVDTSAPAE
jgi:PAS domain S-box-containing protein